MHYVERTSHGTRHGTARHRTALAALAATLLFSLGTAHADNRFGDGVGGAMGGTGSFGAGSVTIHHNLLPEERQEIDADIENLRLMISNLQNSLAQQNNKTQQMEQRLAQQNNKIQQVEQRLPELQNLRCLNGGRSFKLGETVRLSGTGYGGSDGRARCMLSASGSQFVAQWVTEVEPVHDRRSDHGGGGG